MREAVALARIHGVEIVDEALGTAAAYGRFGTGDLASILTTRAGAASARTASESRSLAQGTRGWASIGQPRQHRVVPVDESTGIDDESEHGEVGA